KYIIRLRNMNILTDPIKPVAETLCQNCKCKTELLVPYIDSVWDWALRFICKICGKSYFCECFRKALEIEYPRAIALKSQYSESGWPHLFINAYKSSEFRNSICHICNKRSSNLFFCHPMYGSSVMVHYGPYIYRTSIEKGISKCDAENEIREIIGLPHIGEGWISEIELLKMIRDIFPDKEVVHQARPSWLGMQKLDIFIPSLKLAIEYQGKQHFEPVKLFGGEEGLSQTKKLDEQKARLCKENKIDLIYFSYKDNINRKEIEYRLKEFIP
ncbi:hypothetical protein LLH00_14715, partial [bacterium]|nr:hypothetical protein [bacterium]